MTKYTLKYEKMINIRKTNLDFYLKTERISGFQSSKIVCTHQKSPSTTKAQE